MNAVWIFDLDQTLTPSTIFYGRSILKFAFRMLTVFGWKAPHVNQILGKVREIDQARLKEMQARMERFPGSLVLAYQSICQDLGEESSFEVEQAAYQIGLEAFDPRNYKPDDLIPGAGETLDFLKSQGDLLYCVTAGDERVQLPKYEGFQLRRWFPPEKYIIVPWDKLPAFELLRSQHPDLPGFVVGDSLDSDILPATRAEFTPIYIPSFAFWRSSQQGSEVPPGTLKFKRILEIRDSFYDFCEWVPKPIG